MRLLDIALVEAVRDKDVDLVRTLLQKGANPNAYRDNTFVLIMAVCAGVFTIVESLLENGADPNKIDEHNRTALFFARMKGYKDIEELLLEFGAFGGSLGLQQVSGTKLPQKIREEIHDERYRRLLDKFQVMEGTVIN